VLAGREVAADISPGADFLGFIAITSFHILILLLQGFMGVAVVPVKPVSFERRRKSRSCPMEVEHRESPEPKYIGGYYSHEPLQKPPKSRSTPQNLGNYVPFRLDCAYKCTYTYLGG
jgi:hypothetical protein